MRAQFITVAALLALGEAAVLRDEFGGLQRREGLLDSMLSALGLKDDTTEAAVEPAAEPAACARAEATVTETTTMMMTVTVAAGASELANTTTPETIAI